MISTRFNALGNIVNFPGDKFFTVTKEKLLQLHVASIASFVIKTEVPEIITDIATVEGVAIASDSPRSRYCVSGLLSIRTHRGVGIGSDLR